MSGECGQYACQEIEDPKVQPRCAQRTVATTTPATHPYHPSLRWRADHQRHEATDGDRGPGLSWPGGRGRTNPAQRQAEVADATVWAKQRQAIEPMIGHLKDDAGCAVATSRAHAKRCISDRRCSRLQNSLAAAVDRVLVGLDAGNHDPMCFRLAADDDGCRLKRILQGRLLRIALSEVQHVDQRRESPSHQGENPLRDVSEAGPIHQRPRTLEFIGEA